MKEWKFDEIIICKKLNITNEFLIRYFTIKYIIKTYIEIYSQYIEHFFNNKFLKIELNNLFNLYLINQGFEEDLKNP